MNYKLSKQEQKDYDTFVKLCRTIYFKYLTIDSDRYPFRLIDNFSITFKNTGIGWSVVVRHNTLGIKCNITDYSVW
jgi:hypothetical protein